MTHRKGQPKKESRFVDKTGKEPPISIDGHKPPRMWDGDVTAGGNTPDSPKSR
ncbi:hypothetical protein JIR001_23850 [Polycladomyces abyssicola]|uniref:Uncharacterized protein n=1 Tax=Polycladomyces abyssicola TaxID=1125966 RepID=A0A8D5UFU4_9BACL|nr:hypothetical protein [Polycladomyces abyssicola]BCU82602.1 hypothetical protein JIR001_23850 [Polycladomyces abyssicola]